MVGIEIVECAGLVGVIICGVDFHAVQVGVGDLPWADDSVFWSVDVAARGAASRITGNRQNGAKADEGDDGDDAFHKFSGGVCGWRFKV